MEAARDQDRPRRSRHPPIEMVTDRLHLEDTMTVAPPTKPRHDASVGRHPSFTNEQLADALAQTDGNVRRAASELGVDESTIRRAIVARAPDVGAEAQRLKAARGGAPGPGRPIEVQLSRDSFLRLWEDNGRVILAVARAMGCSQFVVRRLAFDYKVPGAPEKRRPGTR